MVLTVETDQKGKMYFVLKAELTDLEVGVGVVDE